MISILFYIFNLFRELTTEQKLEFGREMFINHFNDNRSSPSSCLIDLTGILTINKFKRLFDDIKFRYLNFNCQVFSIFCALLPTNLRLLLCLIHNSNIFLFHSCDKMKCRCFLYIELSIDMTISVNLIILFSLAKCCLISFL